LRSSETIPAVFAGHSFQPVKLIFAAVGHSSFARFLTVAASVGKSGRLVDIEDQQTGTVPFGHFGPTR
jgi:hypothetical protein